MCVCVCVRVCVCVCVCVCIPLYIVEYCLGIKKNEILPFATTWMDVERISEIIMLSEISQRKAKTVGYYLYVESKE